MKPSAPTICAPRFALRASPRRGVSGLTQTVQILPARLSRWPESELPVLPNTHARTALAPARQPQIPCLCSGTGRDRIQAP
jgi:hypothetical protein